MDVQKNDGGRYRSRKSAQRSSGTKGGKLKDDKVRIARAGDDGGKDRRVLSQS